MVKKNTPVHFRSRYLFQRIGQKAAARAWLGVREMQRIDISRECEFSMGERRLKSERNVVVTRACREAISMRPTRAYLYDKKISLRRVALLPLSFRRSVKDRC